MANKLKKGVEVVVIAGDHKGSKGKILEVIREKNRVLSRRCKPWLRSTNEKHRITQKVRL